MSSYLFTSAGRGVGLEFVTQLNGLPLSQVSTVFATTRSSASTALQQLIDNSNGRLVHVLLAVTDKLNIEEAVKLVDEKLSAKGLDALINNVGIQALSLEDDETMNNLMETLETNVEIS